MKVRKISLQDEAWIKKILIKHWDSPKIISRGKVHRGNELPGFIAESAKQRIGLVTYKIENNECEIVSLASEVQQKGVGTLLVGRIKEVARENNCKRVWLVTTNDNLDALRFFQKRGFHLVKVYRDAIELSRKLKPQIPKIGKHRILLRDEIELELKL